MGCYTATAGHHSNVIRTSRAVLCPLHAQLAATSHRLAFCSTCVCPMQCPLRAPVPAHTGSSFCPPLRSPVKKACVPFVHPHRHSLSAASPVLSSRGPLLSALTTTCFSSMAGPGALPTLGLAHWPRSLTGQALEPSCNVCTTTDLPSLVSRSVSSSHPPFSIAAHPS
jgi:hypothetical protein